MKIKIILSAVLLVVVGGGAIWLAPRNLLAQTNTPSIMATNSAAIRVKPYPLDTCIVDGMKLGSMGDPYVFAYQGQEIKFCCASCKPVFLKDPDQYLKKIQDAETAGKK